MTNPPTSSTATVFISYARAASLDSARALHAALQSIGIASFLDESGIETGDQFPPVLMDALLSSRVVAVLAEPRYFTRWYCLWEWRTALTPFVKACERPGITSAQKHAALRGTVVLLPPAGASAELERFPPELRDTQWPRVTDTNAAAEWIAAELSTGIPTLAERIDAQMGAGAADALRGASADVVRIPYPRSFQGIPRFPLVLPPSLGEKFSGRMDDLWRIDDVLVNRVGGVEGAASLAGALEGMGGVGKTRLALEYVHRFGPQRFRGGLFWVAARATDLELEVNYHQILTALLLARNLPAPRPLAEYHDASLGLHLPDDLVRAFEALTERALVVVDDIPDAAGTPHPIQYWAPMLGLAAVLTTSRLRQATDRGSVIPVWLDVLALDAAVEVLTYDLHNADVITRDKWEAIAEWVGRLPLALTLLNAALLLGTLWPEEIAELTTRSHSLTRELDKAMNALRGKVPDGALRGVTEAFATTYHRLPAGTQYAARLLAHGSPDPLPTELITRLGPDILSGSVRTSLLNLSLITAVPGSTPPLFGAMHAVLADFLRVQADEAGDVLNCLDRLGAAIYEVFLTNPPNDPRTWPLLNACLPHAYAVIGRAATHARLEPVVVRMKWAVGMLLDHQGVYGEARELLSSALDSAVAATGRESDISIGLMVALANPLEHLGEKASACAVLERAIQLTESSLGSDHLWGILAKSNLARILSEAGEYERAHSLAQEAVSASERVLGPDDVQTINAKDTLSSILFEKGDMLNAVLLGAIVLRARNEALGPEHPSTLNTLARSGLFLLARGDFEAARVGYERILARYRLQYGEGHPRTLRIALDLATSLQGLERFADARELIEHVRSRAPAGKGEVNEIAHQAKNAMARLLIQERKHVEAQALLVELVQDVAGIYGPDHLVTLGMRANLAGAYFEQGELEEARQIQEEILQRLRRTVPRTHFALFQALGHLAGTLAALQDERGAQALRDEMLEIQRVMGEQEANYRFNPDEKA